MLNTILLKQRIKELGFNQAYLADNLGISTPTMCQKLNGVRPLKLDEAEKIADALVIPDSRFCEFFCRGRRHP